MLCDDKGLIVVTSALSTSAPPGSALFPRTSAPAARTRRMFVATRDSLAGMGDMFLEDMRRIGRRERVAPRTSASTASFRGMSPATYGSLAGVNGMARSNIYPAECASDVSLA